jgi:3-hydroxyisobutyrate dehydrogenase-like beta-hydroxyacid dehydrogenase
VDVCRPVFAAFSENVLHLGTLGAGQLTKTCNNLMHWAEVTACHEVLSFGKKLGLSPTELREAMLLGSADSRTLRDLEKIGMFWPHKDIDTAMELAEQMQTALPLTNRVSELVMKISAQDLRALFD